MKVLEAEVWGLWANTDSFCFFCEQVEGIRFYSSQAKLVGKGLSNSEKAQKLALQHWLGVGHNLTCTMMYGLQVKVFNLSSTGWILVMTKM
ncbi:uncharacterized protein LOC141678963 isoform X2 [Apium graveolens]|uniref:uncharacterized protein LOC141678963 isoform X2 n=1 Tax=Apium graveolens TaxID=4045 RepID=UPI003D7BE35A